MSETMTLRKARELRPCATCGEPTEAFKAARAGVNCAECRRTQAGYEPGTVRCMSADIQNDPQLLVDVERCKAIKAHLGAGGQMEEAA